MTDSGFNMRLMRENDIPRVAAWMSVMLNGSMDLQVLTQHLRMEYISLAKSDWAQLYMVVLYDQPVCMVELIRIRNIGDYQIYVVYNSDFSASSTALMALKTVIRFLFERPEILRLFISCSPADIELHSTLLKCGFNAYLESGETVNVEQKDILFYCSKAQKLEGYEL